jgi:hypothetical protein
MHKLKTGLPSATTPSGSARPKPVGDDPRCDFINNFMQRLMSDDDLRVAFNELKSDFSNLFHANSAADFFSGLLVTFLDATETLLIGGLVRANAFIDGFLAVIEGVIDTIMGILTAEIDIPVLSPLYEAFFNEKLNILNLITLVAAFPVTIIYRLAEAPDLWPLSLLASGS